MYRSRHFHTNAPPKFPAALWRIVVTALFVTLFVMFASVSASWSQENYIQDKLLDIKEIREDEELTEKQKLKRVYMFLAILNGDSYKTYATRGQEDGDQDGYSAIEEPNDLEEYIEEGEVTFDEQFTISKSIHTSYISTLPKFDRLYPNGFNPIKESGIIDIMTESDPEAEGAGTVLHGSKSLPILTATGQNTGIERLTAFYTTNAENNQVTSYGIIAMRFTED